MSTQTALSRRAARLVKLAKREAALSRQWAAILIQRHADTIRRRLEART
jgi:hypothetical protein